MVFITCFTFRNYVKKNGKNSSIQILQKFRKENKNWNFKNNFGQKIGQHFFRFTNENNGCPNLWNSAVFYLSFLHSLAEIKGINWTNPTCKVHVIASPGKTGWMDGWTTWFGKHDFVHGSNMVPFSVSCRIVLTPRGISIWRVNM